jgi:hypothetical protein
VSWHDAFENDDDLARIMAIGQAGRQGGPEMIGPLLDVALHDPSEVRTIGGVAEVWQKPADVAGRAIASIVHRHGGRLDERVRAAALDLAQDDERAGRLLRNLGALAEAVRAELGASPEERLRVRALVSVRPFDRPPELGARFLADPAPAVRLEALASSAPLPRADLERALTDPVAEVRLAAARKCRHRPVTDAVIAAAETETDPRIRDVYAEMRVPSAGRTYLINQYGAIDTRVALRLLRQGDAGVAAAVAARGLIAIHDQQLLWIVEHTQVAEMRAVIAHLHRHAPVTYLRYATGKALESFPPGDGLPDPADGLDEVQQLTLLREVLHWAEAALGEEASSGLKV